MPTVRKVKPSGNKTARSKASQKPVLADGRSDARKPSPTAASNAKSTPGKAKRTASTSAAKSPAAASKKKKSVPAAPLAAKSDAHKSMRDTFRMPRSDFDLLRALKARARELGRPCKKSDLLRAGLHALDRHDDAQLLHALSARMPAVT